MPGQAAWLDGSDVVTGWVRDGDVWRRDNWTTVFPPNLPPENIDPAYPLANHRDMVWVNGRYQTQVAGRDQVRPGTFFVDYNAKTLFLGQDPTGKTVEATARASGILVRGRDAEKAAGTTIRGLGLRRFAEVGVNVQVPRVTLEKNTIVWNGRYGIHIQGAGRESPPPADIVLLGNRVTANGQAGVRTWNSPRLRVDNNTFSYNNVEGYRRAWGAAGIKVLHFDGFVCRNNLVENNYAFGIWMDENLNDATVEKNECRGNLVAGIMFEISHRAHIAYNVVHHNNVGLMVSNSTKGSILSNTFVDNKTGVVVKQGRRPNHQTPEEGDIFLTREIVVKNNLFASLKPPGKGVLLDAGTGASPAPAMISALDNNAYFHAVPVDLIQWLEGGKKTDFPKLDAFRAAASLEKNGVERTDDPFVDAARGNYRLRPGALPTNPSFSLGALPPVEAK
jgi:hypothetical protein